MALAALDQKSSANIRALVLDDSPFDLRRFGRVSAGTNLEFSLTEARSLAEVRALLDSEVFDILYVDQHLPDARGLDLLPEVRSHGLNGDAALVMVAGLGGPDMAQKAREAGFSGFIEKRALSSGALARVTLAALTATRLARNARAAAHRAHVLDTLPDRCSPDLRPTFAKLVEQVHQLHDERTGTNRS